MTRIQKKEIIGQLLANIYQSQDLDVIAKYVQQLIIEIYNSGYQAKDIISVTSNVDMYVQDVFVPTVENIGKEKSKEFNENFQLSVVALKSVIDFSLLPV
jgi:uncharacterized protein YbgA (DUF1722 family)